MAHNISNFNIYEVLEPMKCPASSSNNIGILVDINDEPDNICNNLRGSDLDNIKKNEFDLVDLYQNIYVTPQHLSKPEKVMGASQIDFNEFSDIMEIGEKTKNENELKNGLSDTDINEFLKVSDTVDKEINGKSNVNTMFSHNEEIEELKRNGVKQTMLNNSDIIEILKETDKLIKDSSDKANDKTVLNHNRELSQKIETMRNGLEDTLLDEADINELLNRRNRVNKETDNCDEKSIFCENEKVNEEFCLNKTAIHNERVVKENVRKSNLLSMLNHNITNNSGIKILKPPKLDYIINKVYNEDIVDKTIKNLNAQRVESPPISNQSQHQNLGNLKVNFDNVNIQLLQTAKLDKKIYAKQRLVKSEREKLRYTKGPALYEKSVVLPQIMDRLAVRKQALQEQDKHRPIFILDSGARSPECACHHSNAGPIPKRASTVKEKESSLRSVQSSSNTNTPPIYVSQSREEHTSNAGGVTLNPIAAMENCNRERLIAYRVRSAFENFVKTGSYY